MLKFIKTLFKKKKSAHTLTRNDYSHYDPDSFGLESQVGKIKVANTYKSPVRSGYSRVEEDKKNKSYPYTDDEPKITTTKTEDNSFMVFNLGDYPTTSSSPCTNHDSYSYDQDNSPSSSSDSSSSDFGGGDFGGGGAGGDY